MKISSKLSVVAAALVLTSAFASADNIVSNTSTVTYNGYIALGGSYPAPGAFAQAPQATFELNNVTPSWDTAFAGSSWVGIASNAGPSGTSNPAQGYYLFAYSYTGETGSLTDLQVYADDTTSVWLNDSLLITQGNLGGDAHCSDNAPSCWQNKYGSLASSVAINNGDTLYFVVEQKGNNNPGGTGNPSGLDFIGTTVAATQQQNPVPEPSSLILLGSGLVGSAGMMMRRMRATRG